MVLEEDNLQVQRYRVLAAEKLDSAMAAALKHLWGSSLVLVGL